MKVEKRISKILRLLTREKQNIIASGQLTESFNFLENLTSQIMLLQVERAQEFKSLGEEDTLVSSPLSLPIKPRNAASNKGHLNLKVINYRRKFDSLKKNSPEMTSEELDLVLGERKKELEHHSEIEWIDNLPFLKQKDAKNK